jgi:cystathionine beta-lyase
MKRSTDLIHHPYRAPTAFEAPQGGVFKASTVIFPDMAAARSRDWMRKTGYTYGLHGTPTTFTLEERLASLEGGVHSLLVPQWPVGHCPCESGAAQTGRRGADS